MRQHLRAGECQRTPSGLQDMRPARTAGFTLVECGVACAVVAVLASLALPALQGRQLRAARFDAVAALTRVQAAQEQHRSHHGLYATELGALRGVAPRSDQGRYTVAIEPLGAEAYRATATATGAQAQDHDCAVIALEVRSGFPTHGPSAACWNR
jgi:type IV pilus assembly protein PilE